ncbi:MAG: phenylalanine--tRNA ligase subunit alpha [Candidatus Diapherotrites archaeon]
MDGDMKRTVAALSAIERQALGAFGNDLKVWLTVEEIAERVHMNTDSARRAFEWLHEKGLIKVERTFSDEYYITPKGEEVARKGLPELRLLRLLKQSGGRAALEELKQDLKADDAELNITLGRAKKKAWVSIHKDDNGLILEFTGLEKEALEKPYAPEEFLRGMRHKPLKKDGLAEEQKLIAEDFLERGLIKSAKMIGQKGQLALAEVEKAIASAPATRAYDIHAPVPEIFAGKRQPYVQFLNRIRRNMVELGFKEMRERLIVQEFYNFDVLFQPQNHPARAWTDSYTMKQPKAGTLPAKKTVDAIRKAHENGGLSKSKGWGYEWSEKIASRLMPNAHGTTADARQMAQGIEIPGKYFVINRCYRPDVVDATHLVEFNQCDGFIAGEGLNFRSLLGVLKQFALEVAGAEKVKFLPDYYPFTEPSVQLSALHPEMGWIEFAGAGIFRPEITENLGIKEPVIAWGMGIDRLAMFKLGIKDIRHLFSDDINWLRNAPLLGVE